jgi:hypothetical protein
VKRFAFHPRDERNGKSGEMGHGRCRIKLWRQVATDTGLPVNRMLLDLEESGGLEWIAEIGLGSAGSVHERGENEIAEFVDGYR